MLLLLLLPLLPPLLLPLLLPPPSQQQGSGASDTATGSRARRPRTVCLTGQDRADGIVASRRDMPAVEYHGCLNLEL